MSGAFLTRWSLTNYSSQATGESLTGKLMDMPNPSLTSRVVIFLRRLIKSDVRQTMLKRRPR